MLLGSHILFGGKYVKECKPSYKRITGMRTSLTACASSKMETTNMKRNCPLDDTCEESLICKGEHNLLYCSAQTDLFALYVFGTRIFTDFMSVTFARSHGDADLHRLPTAMPVQGGEVIVARRARSQFDGGRHQASSSASMTLI